MARCELESERGREWDAREARRAAVWPHAPVSGQEGGVGRVCRRHNLGPLVESTLSMSKRISHSLLDPYFAPLVPRLYALLSIPPRFPPEAIVGVGHLLAIAGAFGFAYSVASWWGGRGLASYASVEIERRHVSS